MTNRRIHDLEDTATTLDSGAYFAVDSDSYTAAKKFAADSLQTAVDIGGLTPTDGNFIVGNGSAWVAESGATVRTSLDVYSTTETDGAITTHAAVLAVHGYQGAQADAFSTSDLTSSGEWGLCTTTNEIHANIGGTIKRFSSAALPLVDDQFLSDLTAGNVNGTSAEPGPGTRAVTDTESKLAISSAAVAFAPKASPGFGDPGLWYGSQSRAAGLAMSFSINLAATNTLIGVGFDNTNSGLTNQSAFYFNNNATFQAYDGGTAAISINTYSASTDYEHMVILRTAGAFFLRRTAGDYLWQLVFVGAADTSATVYPALTNYSATGTVDNIKLVQLDNIWSDDYAVADARIATPATGNTIDCDPNTLVEFTWTVTAAETLEISFRRQDDNERWYIECDQAGGSVTLYSVTGGTPTSQGTASQTWTASSTYRILVQAIGTTIRVYVAGTYKIQKVSATFLQGQRGAAVTGFTTGSNFIAWPGYVEPPFV